MKPKRRGLVLMIGGLVLLRALVASAAAHAGDGNGAPNIVLIVADDLGWGDVGFNGRKEWSTSNLDRLARQGRVFERCYTAAVVCAPSRAAILDGQVHDPLGSEPQR